MFFYLHTLLFLNRVGKFSYLEVGSYTKQVKTAWITGKLSLPIQERSLSYTACANCQKSLEADTTWIVVCPSCRVESEIQDMSRLTVVISDASGCLKANITTPEIEKFIPFTAEDLRIAAQHGDDLCEAIASVIESVTIIAFVRAYEVRVHGASETEMRVNIVKAYKESDRAFADTNPEIAANSLSPGPSVSPQKENTFPTSISKSSPSAGNKKSLCEENNAENVPIIYLLPQTKPSPVVMKKPPVPEADNAASPSPTHKVSEVSPDPSRPKKTTSSVLLQQFVPVSVVKKPIIPEVRKAPSLSVAQKIPQVVAAPSTSKNTTSSVLSDQSVPVSVKSDITNEVNDPRPAKKNK